MFSGKKHCTVKGALYGLYHFFNNIDHFKLKDNIQRFINTERLPKDWFNVYKSATKYDYSYFCPVKFFRKFQRKYPCQFNLDKFGIPQGLAISGVFSNIVSLDFAQSMTDINNQNNGIYRKKSDDFIVVLPKSTNLNDNKGKMLLLKNEISSSAE